jgi:hypothetical protein
MQGNAGKFKPQYDDNDRYGSLKPSPSSFETPRKARLLGMRSQTLMVRSAATLRVSNHEATEDRYRLVSRQPAASASSTEQNQRVPLLTCIWIFAYQRLVGL